MAIDIYALEVLRITMFLQQLLKIYRIIFDFFNSFSKIGKRLASVQCYLLVELFLLADIHSDIRLDEIAHRGNARIDSCMAVLGAALSPADNTCLEPTTVSVLRH